MIIRVSKKNAESLKRELSKEGLIEPGVAANDEKYVYFGVKKKLDAALVKKYGTSYSRKRIERKPSSIVSLDDALKGKLTSEEMKELTRAYDVIGDIAILFIRYDLEKKEKIIAEAILKVHKNVKTVLKRVGKVVGDYRTRDVEFLAGEEKTETLYQEHGCRYLLDISKVFFTPRLATERLRVANKVKRGETVLDMFAGVGAFTILIAKKRKAKVIAVELNPDAVEYMKRNVELKKVSDLVDVRLGDAKKVCKGFKVDRIVMNLPKMAEGFLPTALGVLKPGGVVHYHVLVNEEKFDEKIEETKKMVDASGMQFELLEWNRGRQVSPNEWIVCIDFKAKG